MAHAIVEWTDNLQGTFDLRGLLSLIAAEMRAADGVFPWAGIRVRGVKVQDFIIADDRGDEAFINITVRMAAGRPVEFKQQFFGTLFEAVRVYLADVFATRPLALSMYVEETVEQASFKYNTLHQRFRSAG